MPLATKPPAGPTALSANARTVLEKRYLIKDAKGKPVETPEELFWRVATVVAEADRRYGSTDGGVQEPTDLQGFVVGRHSKVVVPTLTFTPKFVIAARAFSPR